MPERLLGRVDGGDDLVFGELLAGQAGEVGPLVEELDQRGLPLEPDAADEVVDHVAVEPARRAWGRGSSAGPRPGRRPRRSRGRRGLPGPRG